MSIIWIIHTINAFVHFNLNDESIEIISPETKVMKRVFGKFVLPFKNLTALYNGIADKINVMINIIILIVLVSSITILY